MTIDFDNGYQAEEAPFEDGIWIVKDEYGDDYAILTWEELEEITKIKKDQKKVVTDLAKKLAWEAKDDPDLVSIARITFHHELLKNGEKK